jgi:hypothetical protein
MVRPRGPSANIGRGDEPVWREVRDSPSSKVTYHGSDLKELLYCIGSWEDEKMTDFDITVEARRNIHNKDE